MQLIELRPFLFEHLLENVIPFWTDHAIDAKGGINTCIADDGTLSSRDKWLWSQWRAVWVFSKLYNRIEPRESWLNVAKQIAEFTLKHGWDDRVGGWRLCISHDGRELRGCDSVYVDAFAIYGLVELARATGECSRHAGYPLGDAVTHCEKTIHSEFSGRRRDGACYLAWACKTADHALRRLQAPHDQIPHFPYSVPKGARVHGLPMIFSLAFWELGQFMDEALYRDAALRMTEDIFQHFYRADRDLVVERVAADNRKYPPPFGTTVVPGHVLECMWFQIHIARDRQNHSALDDCCRLIRRHIELGWDDEYGGILHAVDADGGTDVGWPFADAKLWWPHVEAMYALLLAYEHTRDREYLNWYWKVHDYSFAHFPVAEHGEWTQKLDRRGQPLVSVPSLPVKDPFHLPRALIYCIDVLDRLIPCDESNQQEPLQLREPGVVSREPG